MTVDTDAMESANTDFFHLEILHMLKNSQQQHGLRHGDHQRYRQYISRKLRRIRKSLHFLQGSKSRVQPKVITKEMLTDVRYLHVKLFEAERSWAYAMQLKVEANTEPRKRFHMLSRLRKAVHHAEGLAELGQADVCDARTKLEMQAYARWMQGILHFEMQVNWSKAKDLLEAARAIYSGLAEAVDEDQKAAYIARADELLPNIRYCAYNLGEACAADELKAMRAAGGDRDQLDLLLEQTRASEAQTVTEVTWMGHVIPVRHEKARLAVLAVQEANTELPKVEGIDGKMALYEATLKACVDAIVAVRDEMRQDPNSKPAPQGRETLIPLEKMTRLQLLHTYLQFVKLVKTAERNLLLIQNASGGMGPSVSGPGGGGKPQELARLYDTVMQTMQEISTVSGVAQDDVLIEEIQARILALRAFRCYYLSQAYLQAKKYAECTALLKRCQRHVTSSLEAFSNLSAPSPRSSLTIVGSWTPGELTGRLEDLIKKAEGDELACRATKLLDMMQESAAAGKQDTESEEVNIKDLAKKPLCDRLDSYIEDPNLLGKSANLVTLPPDFQPVPAKPIFFDLALNHVQFPALDAKVDDSSKKKAQAAAGSGLTGMVKGWLWGGKK